MVDTPEYIDWSDQSISFSKADHPKAVPRPGHAALVLEAQIGGYNMSKVFMDGGSGLNLLFASTMKAMGLTFDMLKESDTGFRGIIPTRSAYSLGKISLDVVFGTPSNFRKEKIEFEVVDWESQYHAILGRPAFAKFMAVPHYVYLKLKMPGNNGTSLTIHGSFSRSDSCDRDFQKIASKFGAKEELNAVDAVTDHAQPPADNHSARSDEFDVAKEAKKQQMEPIIPTEPFIQTQVYDLANGGDLIFERDLFALTEFLGRSPPVFYGGQISDQANGQLQWLIMANLPGKPESPMFRQIQFSLRENTWVDGLAHALQESLARLCGQNSLAIEGERFAHFARHSSVGLPLSLPYHPVLRHHVDHLDYMLYETRSALSNSRSAANHTQQQLNQYADTIKVIAKERRTLRQLVAKRDATIHRLKTKIAVLKETISTQVEQLQILEGEGEGEDIQGDGYSYVSNDNDFEPEEEEDQDFHQHLPAGMDTTFPLRIDG
ncbi:hypothetical protein QYE76_048400 [Lolium multiflorum]|uniref:Uncharacterized protein n=1 Tax=Lolium multiflorum TaxID=4521 RepID=A0AAD8SKS6_LOLMU|nr:hypothetical protein QYE76_048400 [Lolium multiflorum]